MPEIKSDVGLKRLHIGFANLTTVMCLNEGYHYFFRR
jgi:hypothetical protein